MSDELGKEMDAHILHPMKVALGKMGLWDLIVAGCLLDISTSTEQLISAQEVQPSTSRLLSALGAGKGCEMWQLWT